MAKLDIIIPVYNEDENIVTLLKLLDSEVICNFRVLICYDKESDKTLAHLKTSKVISDKILLIKKLGKISIGRTLSHNPIGTIALLLPFFILWVIEPFDCKNLDTKVLVKVNLLNPGKSHPKKCLSQLFSSKHKDS